MNSAIVNKNRPEVQFAVVANRESVVIPIGTPMIFVMDGTNDGLDVQFPSSGTATKAMSLPAGITVGEALAGGMVAGGGTAGSINGQLVQCYGLCQKALISKTLTRSATSAVWASVAATLVGDLLSINTLINAFEYMSAGSSITNMYPWVIGQSVASATTAASGAAGTYAFVPTGGSTPSTSGNGASSDTIAYITSLAKVFVRAM